MNSTHWVNLTPHVLNIVLNRKLTFSIDPCGTVARVSERRVEAGDVGGIPTYLVTRGAVEGLPPPKEGVCFIVSSMVAAQVPERADVFSPGELVRNKNGCPIGCQGLTRSC